MYTKVWFPRIRYAYNKCIPKFDFPNVYQSWFPTIAYNKIYQSLIS